MTRSPKYRIDPRRTRVNATHPIGDFIRPLNNETDARTIANWFYGFWKHIPPYLSLEQEFSGLKESFQEQITQVPFFLVYYSKGFPVGVVCASKTGTLVDKNNLTPWVTSTFVIEKMRHRGVASALLNELHKVVEHLGFRQIYVATREATSFYQSNGYRFLTSEQTATTRYDILIRESPYTVL